MSVLGTKPRSSIKVEVLLTTESSLQLPDVYPFDSSRFSACSSSVSNLILILFELEKEILGYQATETMCDFFFIIVCSAS